MDNAGGRFGISGSNLVVANGALLNFESNTSHFVTVRVTDSGGLTFDTVFNIALTDVAEAGTPHWTKSAFSPSHPAGWSPAQIGDFNGDGTSDIAWYNPATNKIDIWLMQNGQWSASVDVGAHPAGGVAVGVGDFDQNGVSDIMWRDSATGFIDNWMLALS